MANTLGVYDPIFYAQEALIWLTKRLGMASRIYMGFDEERRTFGKGSTINIRRPSTFTAEDAPGTAQDLATETIPIALNNWRTVKFAVTDKEFAYTGDRIVQDHIMPAAYALADDIDSKLCGLWNKIACHHLGTTGTSNAVANVTNTWKKMFDNKVPMQDMANIHFMVGSQMYLDLQQTANFTQWQGSGPSGAESQRTGEIGQRYGFNFFVNQNVASATYIDFTDFAGALVGNHAFGATSLSVDALGAEAKVDKGRILTITGDANKYVVTADATITANAATLSIWPPLKQASLDNAVVTIDSTPDNQTCVQNIAFHRNFAALAMARLPDYDDKAGGLGMQIASVQDPVTGIAVRARIYAVPTTSSIQVALDTLYGYEAIDAHLACRLEI